MDIDDVDTLNDIDPDEQGGHDDDEGDDFVTQGGELSFGGYL